MNGKQTVSLYTDGSCDGNPGKGGYCAIIKQGNSKKEITGSIPYATINKMELIAVIEGLSEVESDSHVRVLTDSAYVENAVNSGRLDIWKKNGWCRIRTGTPVKNATTWQVLLKVIEDRRLTVEFQKLEAHKGNYFNERADRLARQAAKAS